MHCMLMLIALCICECTFRSGAVQIAQVLMATGRKPKTQNIGLEDIGVELNEKGGLKVPSLIKCPTNLFPASLLLRMQACIQACERYQAYMKFFMTPSEQGRCCVRIEESEYVMPDQVDENSRSVNVPSIWGVGDVTNRFPLTPVARMEGSALAHHLFG